MSGKSVASPRLVVRYRYSLTTEEFNPLPPVVSASALLWTSDALDALNDVCRSFSYALDAIFATEGARRRTPRWESLEGDLELKLGFDFKDGRWQAVGNSPSLTPLITTWALAQVRALVRVLGLVLDGLSRVWSDSAQTRLPKE